MKNKRLYKIKNEAMVWGVCAGVAEYFDVDPSLVRIAWVLFAFAFGSGILAYIVAAIILPDKNNITKKK